MLRFRNPLGCRGFGFASDNAIGHAGIVPGKVQQPLQKRPSFCTCARLSAMIRPLLLGFRFIFDDAYQSSYRHTNGHDLLGDSRYNRYSACGSQSDKPQPCGAFRQSNDDVLKCPWRHVKSPYINHKKLLQRLVKRNNGTPIFTWSTKRKQEECLFSFRLYSSIREHSLRHPQAG